MKGLPKRLHGNHFYRTPSSSVSFQTPPSGDPPENQAAPAPATQSAITRGSVEEEWVGRARQEIEDMRDQEVDNQNVDASKRPRIDGLMLSHDLHTVFMRAVTELGINAEPRAIAELMNVPGLKLESVTVHWLYWRRYLLPMELEQKEIMWVNAQDVSEATWAPYVSSFMPNNLGENETGPNVELVEGFGENDVDDEDYYSGNENDVIPEFMNHVIPNPVQEDDPELQIVQVALEPEPEPAEEGAEPVDDIMFFDGLEFRDEDLDGLF